ncbi:MAG: cupin domain-containing protein [Candidatus Omnitrophica bacterium]|nr:cupin domain-containing protein [Candidatus Omnitrophota bacterium]
MSKITVKKPDSDELETLGVNSWPIWEKEISRFDWSYSDQETCYILEGNAKVETEDGDTVVFGEGDLVMFPKGLNCVWDIQAPIRKHYKMG